jgi:carboxymethylenebutenolidase
MTQSTEYVASHPDGGPGLLVLHPWWGLSDAIREVCDALAARGFVAVAPDLYGGRLARTVAEGLDDEAGLARATAAVEHLRQNPAVSGRRLGVIGFSMGVWFALRVATLLRDEVSAAVLYYGTATDIDHTEHRAAVVGHFAEQDEWEPAADVRALEEGLRAAGRSAEFHLYPGVGHWFAESDRPEAYDRAAAELAFERTVDFLRARLR